MNLERIPVTQINPAPYNPRRDLQPGDADYEKLARSIDEFDCVEPPVWNKRTGNLVGGHQRLKVLVARGDTQVPCVVVDLSPEKEKALNLALNKITGDWDEDKLARVLDDLIQVPDFNVGLTGFDLLEVSEMLDRLLPQEEADDDFDAAAEIAQIGEAETSRGDIWVFPSPALGPGCSHRLFCGDAGSAADLDRLLDRARVQLVNSDPPYNVRVEPRSATAIAAGQSSYPDLSRQMHHQGFDVARGAIDLKKAKKQMRAKDRPLKNDFVSDKQFAAMLRAWFGNMARVLEPGRSFYIWGGYANLGNYPPALKESRLYFSQGIVWDKQHPVLTRKDFMGAFEICFYGWREGAGHKFFGPNNATDLWHVKKVPPQKMQHLTEKPVELAMRAIRYSSCRGEHVLDLFGGSGSTLVACEMTGRRAFLMEIDRPYCDVIARRWQKLTGRAPERIPADGDATIPGGGEDAA